MTVKTVNLGTFDTNCYMLESEKAAVVVDPAESSPILEEFLKKNSDKDRLILLTHCHIDHIRGAAELREKTDTRIAIGRNDARGTNDTSLSLSDYLGIGHIPFNADILLCDGEHFAVGDMGFEAIETPGHTEGGMCYLSGDILISGDTLFCGTVGRTDFVGGDHNRLMKSIFSLAKRLDDTVTVYPGHGAATTIGREKIRNPYFRDYEAL